MCLWLRLTPTVVLLDPCYFTEINNIITRILIAFFNSAHSSGLCSTKYQPSEVYLNTDDFFALFK